MSQKNSNAAIVTLAREYDTDRHAPVVLASGVRARLMPVAAGLIEEAQGAIANPPVPIFRKDDGNEYENPDDPAYIAALKDVDRQRNRAAMDTMIMFGVILLDEDNNETGAPADGGWLAKLKWMSKRGQIDLSGLDMDDPLDREFTYKKYIAVSPADIISVSRRSGFAEQEVQQALDSFQDN